MTGSLGIITNMSKLIYFKFLSELSLGFQITGAKSVMELIINLSYKAKKDNSLVENIYTAMDQTKGLNAI